MTLGTSNAGAYAERMRIDNTGNIGIGTTSPNVLLHLYKGAGEANIRLQSAGALTNTRLVLQ